MNYDIINENYCTTTFYYIVSLSLTSNNTQYQKDNVKYELNLAKNRLRCCTRQKIEDSGLAYWKTPLSLYLKLIH